MTEAKATAPKKAKCRVLKAGDGRISKGVHTINGEQYFAKGDEFEADPTIAAQLEDRGFIDLL